jgi:hypothetical protein
VRDLFNLVDAPSILLLASQKIGRHPRPDDFQGEGRADDLPAEAEHIGIGMRSRQSGAKRILTDGGIDTADPVGDHGAAVADSIHKNAALDAALPDSQRRRIDVVGQIDCALTGRAKIFDHMPVSFQDAFDFLLERVARMVACHCDLHFLKMGWIEDTARFDAVGQRTAALFPPASFCLPDP